MTESNAPAARIVSLVPSVTETLLALGVTPVGVTRFCEHPELHAVGGTKDPDIAAIVDLDPDLVVLCEEENRKEDADALAQAGVATCSLAIDAIDDAAFAVRTLAALTGTDAASFESAWTAVATAPGGQPRVRAFVPIWRRPWMTLNGGTYGSSLLASIGIHNVFADADVRYPETSLDEVAARTPDVVLAPSEPYPFGDRHVAELTAIAPVELVDGQDLFWWGVRTPAAVDRLRSRLERWLD